MIKSETRLLGNLDADLASWEKNIQERVVFAGVAAMANVLYEEARVLVPVKNGHLRAAIYRAFSPESSNDTLKTYKISWNKKKAPHGHLIEFGTSRAPAHPFIRPAFDRVHHAIDVGKQAMATAFNGVKGGA